MCFLTENNDHFYALNTFDWINWYRHITRQLDNAALRGWWQN